MRLLAAVDAPVRVERARGRERLITNVAHMWSFARVRANMASKQRGTIENLIASLANPFFLFALGLLLRAVGDLGEWRTRFGSDWRRYE